MSSTSPRRIPSLDLLPSLLAEADVQRVLLLTGGSARFVERVSALLGERQVDVFAGARRHVPEDVLAEAKRQLEESGADAIIALGGGSAIGLGKALKLGRPELFFVAIPTTYSGSELTDMYGITSGGEKRTGRDPKVRPDAVFHDVTLTELMPRALTVTSLMNALAHPIATLAAGLLPDERRGDALDAIARLAASIDTLVQFPDSRRARREALEGAALAAGTLEIGTPGVHHQLAHRLGGRFDLEHGALHAVLLPHTFNRLRTHAPEVAAAIDRAVGVPDLEAALFDVLVRAGAPTSLKAMNVTLAQIDELILAFPDLPRDVVRAAYHGRRPSRSVRREDWGLADRREPISVCGDLATARRVVVALHGRGSTADATLRRVLEIVGDDPEVAVVAPHASDNAWYTKSFTAPRAELTELPAANALVSEVVRRVLAEVPAERVVLFGFSQGASLAIDWVLHTNVRLLALVAFSGGAIGDDAELAEGAPAEAALAGMPALIGASDDDPYMPAGRLDASAALLRQRGLSPHCEPVPGGSHVLHLRHRVLARPLLSGLPEAPQPTGFGNGFALEALPGALPREQNSPRRPPYGLIAEQLSVTSFTAPRAHNRRTWLYRVRPSARHGPLAPLAHENFTSDFLATPEPNLAGFAPLPYPDSATDFVAGIATLGGAGSPRERRGYALHLYAANRNMEDRAFHDADGDLLLLPQEGALTLLTELGVLDLRPGEVALIPRGLRFAVHLAEKRARGWLAETFGDGFTLPERGLIGANGLADQRHFRAPTPWHEDRLAPGFRVAAKQGGALFEATQDTSAFDVVAWHGNACPFVYDLRRFSPVGHTGIDHIDPSVHTVLSAPLDAHGANALDLIAFVPRWDPTEGTFRPPYFHRNVTTELNGVIDDPAPLGSPFQPGTTFLTPSLHPHGPSAAAVDRVLALGDEVADRPHRGTGGIWFQLESALPFALTPWAETTVNRIHDWPQVWGTYRSRFTRNL